MLYLNEVGEMRSPEDGDEHDTITPYDGVEFRSNDGNYC